MRFYTRQHRNYCGVTCTRGRVEDAEGEHTFQVRCAEGDSTPQIEETHGYRPSGSSGIHSRDVDV